MREKLTLLHFLEYSVARRELWRFKRIEWINCLLKTHKIIISCTSSNCWNLFQKTALILTLLWRITLSQGEVREDEGKEGEVAESHCSTISPSPPPLPYTSTPFPSFSFSRRRNLRKRGKAVAIILPKRVGNMCLFSKIPKVMIALKLTQI